MTTATQPATDYTIAAVTFTVPSHRLGHEPHSIGCDPVTGRVQDCTCEQFIYRHRECWAMKKVGQKDHGGYRPRLRVVMRTREPLRTYGGRNDLYA